MNSYFCNVGENFAKRIGSITGHFSTYLKNQVNQTFFLFPVIQDELEKELCILNPKKATGPDLITPKLAKYCADILAKPLTVLYNKSIEQAKFPNALKLAKVIALYKKDSRNLPNNYRPISLLNCFSKLFEKLIYNQMIKFIDKHKILYMNQYGFRKEHSSTLALIDIIDEIKFAIDNGEYAIGIFLDIEKAFDSINHKILLHKLSHYGFRGHINNFLASYLSNRTQFTEVNGIKSSVKYINYGVPQGSILGPLLFLIFVNDIGPVLKSKGRLFADDTSILVHNQDINSLLHQANELVKQTKTWFLLNKMSMHIGKSKFILFHGTGKDPLSHITHLEACGDKLPRVNVFEYIGINIDETLSWTYHIDELCKSLLKYFSIFYNIRDFINTHIARITYFTCIYSRIKYGIEVYGNTTSQNLDRIQVLQNKLMKVLTKRNRRYSTNALHNDLNILKVEDIYRFTTSQFTYKCINKEHPEKFHNYFVRRSTIHDHSTRQINDIDLPHIHAELGRSTTKYTGGSIWNDLDKDITDCKTLYTFKRRLAKHYKLKYNMN